MNKVEPTEKRKKNIIVELAPQIYQSIKRDVYRFGTK